MVLLDLREAQFGEESDKGVENASYQPYPIRISSFSAAPENEMLNFSAIETRNLNDELFHGKESFPWEVKGALQNWTWLYWAMGGLNTSGSDPYTHALTIANTLPALSQEFVYGNGDFSIKLLGSEVDAFDLTFISGEVPEVTLSGFALSGSIDETPGTPAQLATVPFEYHQTSTLTIDSVAYKALCERAQYQYKNNLQAGYGLSSRAPTEIIPGSQELVSSYVLRPADEDLFDLRNDYADFAISHVITRAVNDTLTITIPNAKTGKPNTTSPGGGGPWKQALPVKIKGTWSASAEDSVALYTNPG
ncbi:MAG: phage tail tube protein [Cocleimonas sp.]